MMKDLRNYLKCNLKLIKVDNLRKYEMIKLSEIKSNIRQNLKVKTWRLKRFMTKKQKIKWSLKEKTRTLKSPHKN